METNEVQDEFSPPRKLRTEPIQFRLTVEGAAKLDEMRGAESRSDYMRRLLRVAVAQKIRGPEIAEVDLDF